MMEALRKCDQCQEKATHRNHGGELFCDDHAALRIAELTKHDSEPHMIWAKQCSERLDRSSNGKKRVE